MAPRGSSRRHHFTWEIIRWSELHGYAGVERALSAGVCACACCRERADARRRIVIEAELVLPVAIGDPDVNEVRVLRARKGLAGVEGQTDRFAIEFGLGGGA